MWYIFIITGLTGYLKFVPIKCSVCAYKCMTALAWADTEGGGGDSGSGPTTPEKSQVAIGFLRNTGTDHLGPIAFQGRFVHPSVKYVED